MRQYLPDAFSKATGKRFPRTVALLLCLSLIMSIVPVGVLSMPIKANIEEEQTVFTEEFEGSIAAAGWTASNSFSSYAVKTYTNNYEGTASLYLQADNVWAQSPSFAVTAGKVYTAEFVAMAGGNSPELASPVQLVFIDAEDAVLTSEEAALSVVRDQWKTQAVTGTAPTGAVKAYLLFSLENFRGAYAIDHLVVMENDAQPEPSETTTPSESTEPTDSSEPVVGTTVFSDDFTNFAVSGAAGSGPKDWVLSETGTGDHTYITCRVYHGCPEMTLQSSAATAQSPAFNVTAGKAYTVAFEGYKHVTGAQTGGYVTLTFTDAAGNVVGTSRTQAAGVTYAAWAAEALTAVAPTGAAKAYVTFGITANADSFSIRTLVVTETEPTPDQTEPSESTQPSEPATEPSESTQPSEPATEPSEPATEPSEPSVSFEGTTVFSDDFSVYAVPDAAGSGPKDWVLSETDTGSNSYITCRPYHGRPEMTLQARSATAQSPAFAVTAGEAYVAAFEGFKHIDGEQNGGYVQLTFIDADGNVLSSQKQAAGLKYGDWAQEYIAAIAPAGAAKAYVTFGIDANADSFSVAQLTVIECDTMPDLPEPPHNDTLLNGDFEASDSELIGWGAANGSAIPVIFPGEGVDGSNALKFTNVNKMTELYSEMFSIEGSKVYDLTVWTRLDESTTTTTRFNMFVHWYDRFGNEIQGDGAGAVNSTNKWAKHVGLVVAPDNAAYAAIRFYVSGNNCTLVAYVDNVTFTVSNSKPVDPNAFEVFNGDFERGMEGWRGASSEGAANELVKDGAYKGESLRITANSTATEKAVTSFSQSLELPDAKAVHLTAMSKSANTEITGAYIGLWFYDANGKLVPENTAFTVPLGTTADWTQASLIQAVPEGAATVKIEFGNPSGKTGLDYMLDDIQIGVYTGPEENIRPATPAKPSSSSGGIVDLSELNGSLEELDAYGLPVGWRLLGDAVKYSMIEAADAPDGKYVIQMEKTGQGGNALRSPSVACTPGETYEIKVMIKDIVGTCKVSFMVYDINGARLDSACKAVTTLGTGKWQMYSLLAAMPDNAAYMFLEVWGAMNSTYTCQVDKLRIQVSDIKTKAPYQPTPYEYPTVEELTANITDVYPRVYFTPEEAKAIKLRRFDMLKTKYGWTWNEQYESLLESADAAMTVKKGDKLLVRANTGKMVYIDFLEDVNSQRNRDIYLANSYDENGELFEYPYTGFGALVTGQYASMLSNCSLAYIMTGKAKYADHAIELAMAIADWEGWTDEYWVHGHNLPADASHAWMMGGMVAVYDMCHDRMTAEQLKKLERSIIEEGLVPLSQTVDANSLSNGNLMMVGGILSGAAVILSKENAAEVKQYLDVGLLCMHNALDNFAYSGTIEGHYYTDFGLQSFMPGVGHIYRATKMEGIIDHPFLAEILPYWTIMWAANVSGSHPNYSDGSVATYMQIPLGVLSKITNDPLIDGFLINAGGVGSAFNNLVYLKPDPKPEYLSDYAGVIESFGYGALRTGFADDDMLLVLKANDSQSGHNHYDQNSIQFSIGQDWLITDPGAGSYYYADRSFWTHNGHSTIMVDGNAQMILGLSTTKLVFNNNLYSYIVGSAEKAYGADYDSRMLDKFDRHAIQVNHEDKAYYAIIDDLLSSKPREYTWQMYNGSRGTFSVDDVEVPKESSAMGNKVSMPMGKHVLNLNFVDKDKLEIGDKLYTGGFCLGATTAATKAHQFMTLISTDSNMLSLDINFYDILNGMRSTVPDHVVEGEISWDSSMPVGQEIIKPNVVGTTSCIFYRGNAIGDWLEVPFTIEEGGKFDFNLVMGISDGCCTIKATLDGKYVSEPVDCSGLPEAFIEVPFGEVELETGVHTVRMEIVDKGHDEDYADGWYLINAAGITMMRVGVEIPPADDVVVTEVIDNEQALAGMINYKDNKFDFLMWNRTTGAATAGLLNTDAQQASVLGLVDGAITEGFAATGATTMTYNGKVLFLTEKKVDIVASNTGWQVKASEAQTAQLTAVESEYDYVVMVNGEAVDTKIENGILTVALAEGENTIVVDVDEPEAMDEPEIVPTEPATEPVTEPVAAEDNGNATLWIVVAVAAVLLAGAATGIVLFIKKRKTA